MAQEKIGVESQTVSKKTVTLALAAVFLTYFLASLMILGLSIASPMIAADLNGMDLFSWAISLPALAKAPSSPMYRVAHGSGSLVIPYISRGGIFFAFILFQKPGPLPPLIGGGQSS